MFRRVRRDSGEVTALSIRQRGITTVFGTSRGIATRKAYLPSGTSARSTSSASALISARTHATNARRASTDAVGVGGLAGAEASVDSATWGQAARRHTSHQ